MSKDKIVLITGASSGIGLAAARFFSARGYRVFGTSRKLGGSAPQGYEMIQLDVTNDESVKAAVDEVIRKAGRIDVLINNAGFGIAGAGEESSMTQAKSLFETNVFGLIRMIQAVLPVMRAQGAGRILNVSSILGKVPAPFMALYASTKHAIEGYSESLDHEVRQFNVRSILIEPGMTKTQFEGNSIEADSHLVIYQTNRQRFFETMKVSMSLGDSPDVVAAVMLKAVEDPKPRLRYTAGKQAKDVSLLRRFAPETVFDALFRKQMKIDASA
ncbi:MAG: oxidoreductase [Proteobacteria bacterium]|nr:MAG: oxidoreductase [Pseudomonadota bacterium]